MEFFFSANAEALPKYKAFVLVSYSYSMYELRYECMNYCMYLYLLYVFVIMPPLFALYFDHLHGVVSLVIRFHMEPNLLALITPAILENIGINDETLGCR